jgi:hypothetical protein
MQIRASKGLGDALYLRAIVLHLIGRSESVEVFTPWREVFSDLPVTIRSLSECTGDEDWHHAKPCMHCRIVQNLDAFTMACLQAGIMEPVLLELQWNVRNGDLLERIRRKANGRKVLVFQPLKKATNRNEELSRPKATAYRSFVESKADCFRVKIGAAPFAVDDGLPCELDLFGKISATDAIDIGAMADEFFGEPSFIPIMAEGFDKPHTCMFSRRAVQSGRVHISNITPQRLLHKPHLARAIYDE